MKNKFWRGYMKKLLILTVGLALVSLNAYSTPFYKVKCYDSKNRVISCDDKARTKKIAKVAKKKPAKKETLAERKARERAMALRALARQNESMKSELDALRKANLIAAAKTEEAPKAPAAPVTQVAIPTTTTEIAKNIEPEDQSSWGLGVTNEVSKGFRTVTDASTGTTVYSPFKNELDLAVSYKPAKNMTFTFEEDLYWNWSNPNNDPNSGFEADNPQFKFEYSNLYVSESKRTTIGGEIKAVPAVTQSSRSQGMIVQFTLKGKIKHKFNDSKGYLKFEPELSPIINRFSTSPATQTQVDEDDFPAGGMYYEKLTPNTRFSMAAKGIVGHRILDGVDIEAAVKLKGDYKYADELTVGGQIYTLTPAGWNNSMYITIPRVVVSVSERFTVIGKFEASCKNLSQFKPFGLDKYNDMGVFFALDYAL
jgi:hypothetical protein